MVDVKWIKITTDIFDDEKILLIESLPDSDAIIVIWFKLLCLAGKQNNMGVFMMSNQVAYTDGMLATIFRRKESTVKMALQVFEQFGMIKIIDGVITIPNWGKHQTMDKIEKKNEYMRNYMQDYRKKQKQIASKEQCKTNDESNCKTNSKTNVSEAEIDKDKEIEIDKEEENNKSSCEALHLHKKSVKKFIPPTVDDVRNYCIDRNNNVDPERFVDFYSAKGWMVGRNKMKDWKAAVRTWEKRDNNAPKNTGHPAGANLDDLDDLF